MYENYNFTSSFLKINNSLCLLCQLPTNHITKMTTVFKAILRPILILSKIIGLIHFSYILESDGFLIKNINTQYSQYYTFLDFLRMSVLIILTCIVHNHGVFYVNEFMLIRFWVIIIAGRFSEKWMIK